MVVVDVVVNFSVDITIQISKNKIRKLIQLILFYWLNNRGIFLHGEIFNFFIKVISVFIMPCFLVLQRMGSLEIWLPYFYFDNIIILNQLSKNQFFIHKRQNNFVNK